MALNSEEVQLLGRVLGGGLGTVPVPPAPVPVPPGPSVGGSGGLPSRAKLPPSSGGNCKRIGLPGKLILREKVFGKSYSLENSLQESIFREDLFYTIGPWDVHDGDGGADRLMRVGLLQVHPVALAGPRAGPGRGGDPLAAAAVLGAPGDVLGRTWDVLGRFGTSDDCRTLSATDAAAGLIAATALFFPLSKVLRQ